MVSTAVPPRDMVWRKIYSASKLSQCFSRRSPMRNPWPFTPGVLHAGVLRRRPRCHILWVLPDQRCFVPGGVPHGVPHAEPKGTASGEA